MSKITRNTFVKHSFKIGMLVVLPLVYNGSFAQTGNQGNIAIRNDDDLLNWLQPMISR